MAWRQSGQCEGSIGHEDTGVECTGCAILHTPYVGNGMFGGSWVFPSDGGSGQDGCRLWDEIGRSAVDNDGGIGRHGCARPRGQEANGENDDNEVKFLHHDARSITFLFLQSPFSQDGFIYALIDLFYHAAKSMDSNSSD